MNQLRLESSPPALRDKLCNKSQLHPPRKLQMHTQLEQAALYLEDLEHATTD